jgi:hypothetical protein
MLVVIQFHSNMQGPKNIKFTTYSLIIIDNEGGRSN